MLFSLLIRVELALKPNGNLGPARLALNKSDTEGRRYLSQESYRAFAQLKGRYRHCDGTWPVATCGHAILNLIIFICAHAVPWQIQGCGASHGGFVIVI